MDISWLLRRLIFGRPVVIVSGLPRSGTSMVMRMLGAGGLEAVTDGVRGGDEDNPHGYFEHERVKNLGRGGARRWLKGCRGRALKVVSPLLRHLPRTLCYQVVFLERDLEEVLDSQERMLRRRAAPAREGSREALRQAFARELWLARRLLARGSSFRTLFLSYGEVLERPAEAAAAINAFLGGRLDEAAMAAMVDGSLRSGPRGGRSAAPGRAAVCCGFALLTVAAPALAYVGPGAGFALVSTAFVFVFAVLLALLALLTWPARALHRLVRRGRRVGVPGVRRVVILGFDGQDPAVTERLMDGGFLPNFSRLRDQGCCVPLATTLPASSPVAWSTFMTGCNPGKHRIFDFLVPNRRTMLPELSSARVLPPARTLKLGRYRIPLSGPRLSCLRRGKTFWSLLGESGVFSTVIRVPMTFPPEKFSGLLLSAASVPDLRGSQGTYFLFSSEGARDPALKGGLALPLTMRGTTVQGVLPGPLSTIAAEAGAPGLPFTVRLDDHGKAGAVLEVDGARHVLREGEYTPWIRAFFRAAPGVKVRGICRFLLLEAAPCVRLYATPLQIDPEHPALPISHPPSYAVYLAKAQGAFATLGVAEDLAAVNEGVIGEGAFLEQCRLVHQEREAMLMDALEKTRDGALVCVFDLLDRVQHLCFGRGPADGEDAVRDAYATMDRLLGRVLAGIDARTVLMVLSDHGFQTFRRAVDLNAWLREAGLLTVKEGAAGADLLRAVDWGRTRAYAVGFGGIFLNRRGREAHGIVEGRDAPALKADIRRGLAALRDPADGGMVVEEVFDGTEAYRGPYRDEAPDLVAGFCPGYRASWTCVTGGVGADVFTDNLRPWKGDHNVHPGRVPGIFLCNRPVDRDELRIEDIAPSVLRLFGVPIPGNIDGRPFAPADRPAGGGASREGAPAC